jgi:putative hydrolase of the HAD superfamily
LCIAEYFEAVVVSSEVGASKPHPRIFHAALKVVGVPAQECLHVGDEERADVVGARAAGIPAIRVERPVMTLLDVADKVRCREISRLRSAGI